MRASDRRRQVGRVRACLSRWCRPLGLDPWDISVGFTDESLGGGEEFSVLARCWADWRYLKAKIAFCTPAVEACDDDTVEEAVVHELVHVLVCEMRPPGESWSAEHEERVVTGIARAFLATRRAGVKDAKRRSKR